MKKVDYEEFMIFAKPIYGEAAEFIYNSFYRVIDELMLQEFLGSFNGEDTIELPKIEREKEHSLKDDVKFISYDGSFPNLCSGELILKINNKEYKFGKKYDPNHKDNLEGFWITGGGLDEDYEPFQGPWNLSWKDEDYPEEIRKYKDVLIEIFNEHVPYGCCGGCS